MTDTIKLIEAVEHMQRAGISVDSWVSRVKSHVLPSYPYKQSEVYKALKALEAAAKPTPPVPAPTIPPTTTSSFYLAPVQRCLFLTDDISRALESKNRLLIATADLGYRHNYTDKFISDAIEQGRFRVWCDCRESGGDPPGTPPHVALEWLDQLGLPHRFFYGQCESEAEFDMAYNAGARLMVGKLGSLNNDQLLKIKRRQVLVTNETYWNVELPHNAGYAPDWLNVNEGVGSNTTAVYESPPPPLGEGAVYYSLPNQIAHGHWNEKKDCVYVAGFRKVDWDTVCST